MPHLLETKVREVARRAWWLMFGQAVAWALVWVAVGSWLLVWADYIFRYPSLLPRLLAFVVWLGVILGSIWKFVIPVLLWRWDAVAVAQRVERCFPQLGDRLSMSLAFLAESAAGRATGSAQLRAALVTEVTAQIGPLRLTESLDSRGLRRGLSVLLVTSVTLGCLMAWDYEGSSFALRRLVTPWQVDELWPRRHHLSWVSPPLRLPVGADFEAELIDLHGSLPHDVRFEYRLDGESPIQEQAVERRAERAWIRLERVHQSFQFRAAGGDDNTMDWQRVEVVQKPRLLSVRTVVTPPSYSGLAAFETAGEIRTLAGSTLTFSAEVDQPLQAVQLLADFPAPVAVQWSPQTRRLQIPGPASPSGWTLTNSGEFWFAWEDEQGMASESTEHYSVTVVHDANPTVTLERPLADAAFTPNAVVPIRVVGRDDLALQQLALHFGDDRLVLFERAEPPRHTALSTAADMQVVETTWDLASWSFEAGQTVELSGLAKDFLSQEGRSRSVRLKIVTPAEIQQGVAARHAELLQRLQQARQTQTSSSARTRNLLRRLDEPTAWGQTELDDLQGNEQHQGQVTRLLDGSDGATQLAAQMIEQLRVNRIENPELVERIESLSIGLAELQKGSLASADQAFHLAVETLRAQVSLAATKRQKEVVRSELRRHLQQAVDAQQETILQLDRWIDALVHWNQLEQYSRETERLLELQQDLIAETNRVDTLGKTSNELTAAEQAQLERLAERQAELAERLERLVDRMRDMLRATTEGDQSGDAALKAKLAEVLEQAEQGGAAAAAREAMRNLRENRIGDAATFQQQSLQGLHALLAAFPQTASSGSSSLRELLVPLVNRQAAIVERLQSWIDLFPPDPSPLEPAAVAQVRQLADEQQQVLAATRAIERRFAATQAVVGLALREACERMEETAAGLHDVRIDSAIHVAARTALERLRLLITALEKEAAAGPQPTEVTPPAPDAVTNKPPGRTIIRTDLEMLRLWQDHLRQWTAELEADRRTESVDLDAVRRLAEEQQKLATTAAQLVAAVVSEVAPTAASEARDQALIDDLDAALRAADVPGFSGSTAPAMERPPAGRQAPGSPGPPAPSAPPATSGSPASPASPGATDPAVPPRSPGSPASPEPAASPAPQGSQPRVVPAAPAAANGSNTEPSRVQPDAGARLPRSAAEAPPNSSQPASPSPTSAMPTSAMPTSAMPTSAMPTSAMPTDPGRPGAVGGKPGQPDRGDVTTGEMPPLGDLPAALGAGEDIGGRESEPLALIQQEMQAIAQRLQRADTSPETQLLQRQVIDRLSAMLAGGQPQPSAQPDQPAGASSDRTPGRDQPSSGRDANPRADGQPTAATGTPAQATDLPRGWGRMWGNLPDRIRDQILTPDREQFLPAYEDLIKRYYERLAEEDQKR